MNIKKKIWVNSMFSEFPSLEKNKTAKLNKSKAPSTLQSKERETENESATEQMSFNSEEGAPGDAECKYQTLSKKSIENTTNQFCNENWINIFAPTNSEELAVHPKKILELQQWFQHCTDMRRKMPAQFCLLTGPSGSGKTATVRILSSENKISVQEWINPVDQEIVYNLGDQVYSESHINSQIDAFKNFLFKASRYRSLLQPTSDKRLLLVEDFPNFLIHNPTVFQDILEEYLNYGKSPLIFIVTDARKRGLNISFSLFTDQIKQKFSINHISFNPVASTIMQKAMKRFCSLMHSPLLCKVYKSPSPDIIDSIIVSAQGDIRNALINLHFSSLKGAPSLLTKRMGRVEESKASKKRKVQSTLKYVGRDESLTVMHALGRVFNPKYAGDKRFIHSPEDLSDAFRTEPKKFIDLIQSNYLQHFSEIDYVLDAANGLSLSDLILNEYRDDTLALTGLNLGIRSVMVANINPATGWMPIKGKKLLDRKTSRTTLEASKLLNEHHFISPKLYALDYKTFINILSASASEQNEDLNNM